MNQLQWDNALKFRNKHFKWIFFIVLCSITVSFIIICNNEDQLLDNSVSSGNNESENSDVFFFNPDDSLEIEKKSNSRFSENFEDTAVLSDTGEKETVAREVKKEGPLENKVQSEVKINSKNDSANVNAGHIKVQEKTDLKFEKKVDTQDIYKIHKIVNNVTCQHSVRLPAIHYKMLDRKDIIISLALELFYIDSVFEPEIFQMRNELKVVALNLLQNKELASFNKDVAARELENKMNELFERKTLCKVIIREFNIEKVVKQ